MSERMVVALRQLADKYRDTDPHRATALEERASGIEQRDRIDRELNHARAWRPNGHDLGPFPLPTVPELPVSWNRVDLGPALRGELTKIEPLILKRDDGAGLFYEGQLNWIHGADGVGKSWVALLAAAEQIKAGHGVLWINLEDPDERVVAERLVELGADHDFLAAHFDYRGPVDPIDDVVIEELVYRVTVDGVNLVVIDSLGEALGLDGKDENADPDIVEWVSRVGRRLIAAGTAVIVVDHGTKAADNPLFPSGSKRKRASITGAGYLVDAPVPMTKEHGGRLRLTCAKDRHGNYARGQDVATIEFTRYPDGGMTVHVRDALPTEQKPTTSQLLEIIARKAVAAAKDAGRPLSKRELISRIDVRARSELKHAAIDHAVGEGAIRTQPGDNRRVDHVYVHDLELVP